MNCTFIAVNYNGFFHTKNYIDSVLSLQKSDSDDVLSIIIVDNNSKDEDYFPLKAYCDQYSQIILLRLDSNIGYFGGLNKGLEKVDQKSKMYIVIGNNDLVFDIDFFDALKKIKSNSKTMVLAPNIRTLSGRLQNPHVINKVSTWHKITTALYFSNYYVARFFGYFNKYIKLFKIIISNRQSNKIHARMKIKRGIGACYVLTPLFFENFEKLDDRVFLWGEEALLSNQIESVNGETWYEPSLRITHCESVTVSHIKSKNRYSITKKSYSIYKEFW